MVFPTAHFRYLWPQAKILTTFLKVAVNPTLNLCSNFYPGSFQVSDDFRIIKWQSQTFYQGVQYLLKIALMLPKLVGWNFTWTLYSSCCIRHQRFDVGNSWLLIKTLLAYFLTEHLSLEWFWMYWMVVSCARLGDPAVCYMVPSPILHQTIALANLIVRNQTEA